jgi:steroid 5-alpha reductase family enzyme
MAAVLLDNALWLLGSVTVLWVVSVFRRDVSIIDPFWSLFFLLVGARTLATSNVVVDNLLFIGCLGLWSLRLAIHLGMRTLKGHEEDPRYQAFRRRFGPERYWWVSFFQVFLLQGCLALLISIPHQFAISVPQGRIDAFDVVGAAVFVIGFLIEAFADQQLTAHRSNPAKKGKVLDSGLWRYSRHPNYFGEALLGWGLWIMSMHVDALVSLQLATILCPSLMTFLLLRVSGVTLLEEGLTKTKPGYADYVSRTSSFIPWPPRAAERV